jgi:hypothetical protein
MLLLHILKKVIEVKSKEECLKHMKRTSIKKCYYRERKIVNTYIVYKIYTKYIKHSQEIIVSPYLFSREKIYTEDIKDRIKLRRQVNFFN